MDLDNEEFQIKYLKSIGKYDEFYHDGKKICPFHKIDDDTYYCIYCHHQFRLIISQRESMNHEMKFEQKLIELINSNTNDIIL